MISVHLVAKNTPIRDLFLPDEESNQSLASNKEEKERPPEDHHWVASLVVLEEQYGRLCQGKRLVMCCITETSTRQGPASSFFIAVQGK